MNIARSATIFCVITTSSMASSTFFSFPRLALAAPSSAAKMASGNKGNSATLSFDVTARVGASGQYAGPQQTVQAHVLLRGNAARIESSSGGTSSVVLFSPPYIYRLLPQSKAGVRWKVDPKKPSHFADFDPQQLLRDPSKIKVALLRGGAKKIGVATLAGVPVDIYQAQNFGRRGQTAKVWLRRGDSLPLRLEAAGGQIKIVASWRNYARPQLPASLFSAPPGFRVRTMAGNPPFSAL
ncbi:hypothetical protein B1R32_10339 [Abditibacterium utsteinense]|uniref:Outer membrane lipoprotein-sorting protein n=1 Tax=Abditibacterium utsteinense TaxID=1960156 RepID=A0A2S8SVE5_9BACT|nr:hypothetical protein [Abditibacterium utsteinense]PQV64772.1 hypothetical protein B1R32_10339 [Abditibacterium utsteinense]